MTCGRRWAGGGLSFAADGAYGEKRELGYLGTTGMYTGLLILLAVGCWDNLRQFSGVLLDGMGSATSLNKLESYRHISKGPLAHFRRLCRECRSPTNTFQDSTYPMGA